MARIERRKKTLRYKLVTLWIIYIKNYTSTVDEGSAISDIMRLFGPQTEAKMLVIFSCFAFFSTANRSTFRDAYVHMYVCRLHLMKNIPFYFRE